MARVGGAEGKREACAAGGGDLGGRAEMPREPTAGPPGAASPRAPPVQRAETGTPRGFLLRDGESREMHIGPLVPPSEHGPGTLTRPRGSRKPCGALQVGGFLATLTRGRGGAGGWAGQWSLSPSVTPTQRSPHQPGEGSAPPAAPCSPRAPGPARTEAPSRGTCPGSPRLAVPFPELCEPLHQTDGAQGGGRGPSRL